MRESQSALKPEKIVSSVAFRTFRIHTSASAGWHLAYIHFYSGHSSQGQLLSTGELSGRLEGRVMKYAGLLVMPAGFGLSIAALLLFPASPQRAVFVLCGLAVEAMGLVVAVRGHMQIRGEDR